MQGVVQLVQDGRGEHPDGLVALDLLQPLAERLGARRGFARLRELRPDAQVVRGHAEEAADEEGQRVVDEAWTSAKSR